MTVLYRGRNSANFLHDDFGQVVNGGAARANTPNRVAKNQTWLAYRDVPAVNFFSGLQLLESGGVTSLTPNLRVMLPPGCTHVEFWFLAAGQIPPETTVSDIIHGLLLTSAETGETSELTTFPLTIDVKFTPSIDSARWVAAKGISRGSPFAGTPPPGPFALKCRDLPVSAWTESWVSIDTIANSLGVIIFSAYYKAVAPEGGLVYEDGITE